jgi:hypothetical protein
MQLVGARCRPLLCATAGKLCQAPPCACVCSIAVSACYSLNKQYSKYDHKTNQ